MRRSDGKSLGRDERIKEDGEILKEKKIERIEAIYEKACAEDRKTCQT